MVTGVNIDHEEGSSTKPPGMEKVCGKYFTFWVKNPAMKISAATMNIARFVQYQVDNSTVPFFVNNTFFFLTE